MREPIKDLDMTSQGKKKEGSFFRPFLLAAFISTILFLMMVQVIDLHK